MKYSFLSSSSHHASICRDGDIKCTGDIKCFQFLQKMAQQTTSFPPLLSFRPYGNVPERNCAQRSETPLIIMAGSV